MRPNREFSCSLVFLRNGWKVSNAGEIAGQFLAEIGVGNGDQCFGALAQRFSMKVDGSKFGDHPMDVPARAGYTGAAVQFCNNPRKLSVCRKGGPVNKEIRKKRPFNPRSANGAGPAVWRW